MLTQAMEKLRSEITNCHNNPYVQVVGDFLLNHLEKHPQDAEKLLAADKTIGKSLDAMRKVAETKKVGNCAVLTDEEGFAVVLKYFGIDGISASVAKTSIHAPLKSDTGFKVRLEDLL